MTENKQKSESPTGSYCDPNHPDNPENAGKQYEDDCNKVERSSYNGRESEPDMRGNPRSR